MFTPGWKLVLTCPQILVFTRMSRWIELCLLLKQD
jgi:hypothetical protein